MNKVVITTKKYYSFYEQNEKLDNGEWVNLTQELLDYFAGITMKSSECKVLNEDIIADFFAKMPDTDNEAEVNFWSEDKTLKMIKYSCNECVIYLMPCIPRNRLETFSSDRLGKLQRQNYIGYIIKNTFEDLGINECNKDDFYIVVHDRDIFNETVERIMTLEDVDNNSVLFELINDNILSPNNIFGFKHSPTESKMFSIILKLLSTHDVEAFFSALVDTIETEKAILL